MIIFDFTRFQLNDLSPCWLVEVFAILNKGGPEHFELIRHEVVAKCLMRSEMTDRQARSVATEYGSVLSWDVLAA